LAPKSAANALTACSAWVLSSAPQILAIAALADGARIWQSGEHVAGLVPPAALLAGVGEHVADGLPEPERAVADGEHRGAHPAAFAAA
jgi:hypothetical protein